MRHLAIVTFMLWACGCGSSRSHTSLGACGPADYIKCDGSNVLSCICTTHGPQEGIDLAGNPVYQCEAYSWVQSETCSVACDTNIAPSTGCIASKQPVPECAQTDRACWNGNYTFCENGYPLPTTPCAQGTQCTVVSPCGPLCLSKSQAFDSRCPQEPVSQALCLDNTAYFCSCGYLVDTMACGAAPNECVVSGTDALCGLPP